VLILKIILQHVTLLVEKTVFIKCILLCWKNKTKQNPTP